VTWERFLEALRDKRGILPRAQQAAVATKGNKTVALFTEPR